MNKMRTVLSLCAFCCASSLSAGIVFRNLDLNDNDEMLFTVRQKIPGTVSYSSLFSVDVTNKAGVPESALLTCYPEQMELLGGGSILQLRNRYGIVRYNVSSKNLAWVKKTETIPVNSYRTVPYTVSPDGKWSCFVEKTGYATGMLILENTLTGAKAVLNDKSLLNFQTIPARWAADSSILFYEKDNSVYFSNPEAVLRGVETEERYRKIGSGLISTLYCTGKYVIYIDGDIVYRISLKELYTLGLYSGIIGKGTAVGRLPDQFIPTVDFFSVDDSISSLLLVKDGKTFSFYHLSQNSCEYLDILYYKPYINSNGAIVRTMIFWGQDGNPAVWFEMMPYSGAVPYAAVCRITDGVMKLMLAIDNAVPPVVSPDRTRALFFTGSSVLVYDTTNWKCLAELQGEKAVAAVWASSDVVYVGGEYTVRRWTVSSGNSETLFLSSAERGFWSNSSIAAQTGNGKKYRYKEVTHTWTEDPFIESHKAVIQNGRYRVFCGTTPNTQYENALYIRTLSGKAVTKPVYPASIEKTATKKQVAFVFDAYNSPAGLAQILSVLNMYHITGTFCLNGEFIRRYPIETKQIAATGNECASLFFTTADLITDAFFVDEDFIRRGLARNEDEFYQCTGHELSLLWHAPYYHVSDALREYGKKAGYAYIDAIVPADDMVTLDQAAEGMVSYKTSVQLINGILTELKQKDGGIVPVTVGILHGIRDEYLYDSFDLLVSAVLDEGYDIVSADRFAD
jgi:hypothetical protein